MPKKLKTIATKKQQKEKPKGDWLLPDDGLHEALAQIPLIYSKRSPPEALDPSPGVFV